MKRKRSHSQGLDQLGPKQPRLGPGHGMKKRPPWRENWWTQTISAAQLSSLRFRKVKITLSDHLFSSDEIKTKEDT